MQRREPSKHLETEPSRQGDSECKAPGAGVFLSFSRNSKEACVTDTEGIKEKVMEMKSEGARGLNGRILQTTIMASDVYSS